MRPVVRFLGASGIAAVIVGTTWVLGSVVCFPMTAVDFDSGARIFQARCASCHAAGSGSGDALGPNLGQIGLQAARRAPTMSAEEYLMESILMPDAKRAAGENGVMPADIAAGLKPDQIVSIVGFLMTRGGSPDSHKLLDLLDNANAAPAAVAEEIDFAEVEAGKVIFLGKGTCSRCHLLRDLPGHSLRAPSLLRAGNHNASYLREAICDPNRHVTPGYRTCNVWLRSGKALTGRMLRRDDRGIELLADSNGELKYTFLSWSDIDVDDDGKPMLTDTDQSLMPSGMQKVLSDREIDQVVAFLKTLK